MVIFKIIWASWLISEIMLSRFRRAKSPNTKGWDKSSLSIMWVTICISISLGVIIMIFTPITISRSYLIAYLGLTLIISGIVIRIASIRTLGNFFTVNLAIHNDHQLITTGLYKNIRHPSYTGSLLSFIGLGVSFNNWLSLAVIVIPIIISFIYRINVEEQMLLKQFGSEYIAYKKNSKRLIPLIY
jgi:protein-S-isoprenylcysteine O-methyltransferase Ste14